MAKKYKFKDFKAQRIVAHYNHSYWYPLQESLYKLGKATARYMRVYIKAKAHRKPTTGRLEKAIRFKSINTEGKIHWGVGNTANIQKNTPYWYVVNFGKMITGEDYVPYHGKTIRGSFNGGRPDSGKSKEPFKRDGKYLMTPNKAIRPMGYIEATRKWLAGAIRETMRKYK